MKIHAKLNWSTIIDRLNKAAGENKYRLDNCGSIYEFNKSQNAYVHIFKCAGSEQWSKQMFIDEFVD